MLHSSKTDSTGETQLTRELHERFYSQTEVHPNQILFHDAAEMRRLQGVGVMMKEQKVVDHRPRTDGGVPEIKRNLNW